MSKKSEKTSVSNNNEEETEETEEIKEIKEESVVSESLSSSSKSSIKKNSVHINNKNVKFNGNDMKIVKNGLSDRAQMFLYGSLLLLLLVLVVITKQKIRPGYRSRKGNELTFINKLRYGKHGERYNEAMEEKEQEIADKTEEFVRLINNKVGNGDDDEYTRV